MKRIVMVCTGNTCRSPMAEALLRAELIRQGVRNVQVESAGVCAVPGAPASAGATEAMRLRGLDLSGHRARRATPQLLEDALAICMTSGHLRALRSIVPDVQAAAPAEIPDPFGGDLEEYLHCADAIEQLVQRVMKEYNLGGN